MTTQHSTPTVFGKGLVTDDGPYLPKSPTLSSQSLKYDRSGQTFPLMRLPPELRRLIYWDIMEPYNRDRKINAEKPDEFILGQFDEYDMSLRGVSLWKHRANFLVANRQIYAEASEVWYGKHYFRATILPWLNIEGATQGAFSIQPTPWYLPKLRNIKIHITASKFSMEEPYPNILGSLQYHHLEYLCQVLVASCQQLRSVIFVVPCCCHKRDIPGQGVGAYLGDPFSQKDPDCLTLGEFEQLIRPLRRLRVSRNISLGSLCKKRAHNQQPSFDQLAMIAQSSDPIEALPENMKLFWDVMGRARPYLTNRDLLSRLQIRLYDLLNQVDTENMLDFNPGPGGQVVPIPLEEQRAEFESALQEVTKEISHEEAKMKARMGIGEGQV